jgi:hypothetical protein
MVGGAYKVMYRQELPVLDVHAVANNEVVQILLNKSDVWCYEDEYRIIGHDGDVTGAKPQFLPITNKSFLSLPPGVLAAVVVGCRADFDTIKAFVEEYAAGLPVKRMIRDEHRFSLRIEG